MNSAECGFGSIEEPCVELGRNRRRAPLAGVLKSMVGTV